MTTPTNALPLARTSATRAVDLYRAGWFIGLGAAAVGASLLQVSTGATQRGFFVIVAAFLFTAVAAGFDVATRRIPNAITYPAIVLGLLANAAFPAALGLAGFANLQVWFGSSGPEDALVGFALCAGIGIFSFIVRGLGGGDVKAMAALGAILGCAAVIPVLFNALVVAAVVGVVNWTAKGTLIPRLQIASGALFSNLILRRPLRDVCPFGKTEAPFALSLLIGLILAQFVHLHSFVF